MERDRVISVRTRWWERHTRGVDSLPLMSTYLSRPNPGIRRQPMRGVLDTTDKLA
jgi:hypothetical protein